MNKEIKLAPRNGGACQNQAISRELRETPFLNPSAWQDKLANGSTDTWDGYRFETDWNGSTNYMRVGSSKNPFSTAYGSGVRFYSSDSIGKDRKLYAQWWNRTGNNLYLPNVIGYTGFWRNQSRQYHPRLEMVVFHYCDANGAVTHNYKVDELLQPGNNSSHYWAYGQGGQHDSGVDWHIAYQLPSNKRATIVNGDHRLFGMSWQITFRTPGGVTQGTVDGTFYQFRPIIADGNNAAELKDADWLKSGSRMVLPAYDNTYPRIDKTTIKLT